MIAPNLFGESFGAHYMSVRPVGRPETAPPPVPQKFNFVESSILTRSARALMIHANGFSQQYDYLVTIIAQKSIFFKNIEFFFNFLDGNHNYA